MVDDQRLPERSRIVQQHLTGAGVTARVDAWFESVLRGTERLDPRPAGLGTL